MEGYVRQMDGICAPCGINTYRSKDFEDLIRLEKPYIVSTAQDFNATSGRFDSLCGVETCAGNTGVLDKTGLTVLALLPRNRGGPVFASESTRDIYIGSATRPVYNATGGPAGNGDVKFDKFRFLSGGARNFSIRTNGGYSVVAVVQFTHNAIGSQWERLIDFSSANVEIRRQGNSNNLEFRAAHPCVITLTDVIAQDQWNVIIAKLDTHNSSITFSVNGQTVSEKCGSVPREQYTGTEIGKQSNTNGQYFEGSMAGMFFVDSFLDDAATAAIVASIYAGEDLLRAGHPRIVVNTGSVMGHGAASPVAFVGGDRFIKLQWGALSVPAEFTMCSVTRYTGERNQRILGCTGNPLGSANFIQGHVSGYVGSTLYGQGENNANIYPASIGPKTNWVVVCGRNIATENSITVAVNDKTRLVAAGGVGSCALGINQASEVSSSWQFSKLYIWDYYLTDTDFALASSSLYDSLLTGSKEAACSACPIYTQSSINASMCECIPGAYAPDTSGMSVCKLCAPGSFKAVSGPGICSPCPAGSYGGGISCSLCPAGTFSTATGSLTVKSCTPCKRGTYNEITGADSSDLCLSCASGKYHRNLGARRKDDCKECNCAN
jgi:hypothetical protein